MTTYEQFDRDAFEAWLDSLHKRWYQKKNTRGVYVVRISDNVGVEINSTLTGRDDVVSRGQASIQMALVSLYTGQVLNKKDQGQSHFKRTKEWRANLAKGVARLEDAYLNNKPFYDNIAMIADRGDYQKGWELRIKAIPGYETNEFLSDILSRIMARGVLSSKQVAAVERAEAAAQEAPEVDEELLQQLRDLWRAANRARDARDMDFLKNLGDAVKQGRRPSDKQMRWLDNLVVKYQNTRLASAQASLLDQWVF